MFLGNNTLKVVGAVGVAAAAGVGAVAAAPLVLTAVGFTSAGKNTLFSFLLSLLYNPILKRKSFD